MEDIMERDIVNGGGLTILWTNADPLTSHHMVMMYARNAKMNGWFDSVTVVLWGAPQRYVIEDETIRLQIEIAKQAGVEFSACVSCSNNLSLTSELDELGIKTMRWGEKLSNILKSGEALITV
jgi:hypothetical protein